MKRTLIAMAAGGLLLSGCSSSDGQPVAEVQPTEAPVATTTAATTTAAATTTFGTPANDRDNRVKAFGEESGTGCDDSPESCAVRWTLDTPVDATGCSPDEPTENGRLIAIPISVQTGTGQDLGPFNSLFNPNSFSALRADGVTLPQVATFAAYTCDESNARVPDNFAPASKYEGMVVLDVPADAQAVIFRPVSSETGWEWPLG